MTKLNLNRFKQLNSVENILLECHLVEVIYDNLSGRLKLWLWSDEDHVTGQL